ncbi:MAG: hypothetical protein P8Z79_22695 [Sedimentisphaerales bacterium]|jgi:hypothetical protein
MTKRNIVLVMAAALVLQIALTEQVYAWVGCPVDVRFSPLCYQTFKCKAQGGMQYYPSGGRFWFDFGGIGLERCKCYTLVCGTSIDNLVCLGSGRTNRYGQIHIYGRINTGDLCNAQVALVLTEDVDRRLGCMIDWDPCRYLLGACRINYKDTYD